MEKTKFKDASMAFWANGKNVFWFGFVIAIIVTSLEILRGRAENFQVFYGATLDFWNGISPYTQEFVDNHGRYFLYTPVFPVLFMPFALLPYTIAGYAWNLFNYTLFFFSVSTLPEKIAVPKIKVFLYLLPLLGSSIFPFQYNITVCSIFLFAFTLLEKGKPFWAILLIMLSATTKVYGAFELALLFCYKNTWRNFGYAALCGIFFLALPLLQTGLEGFVPCYDAWATILHQHNTTEEYVSLIYIQPFRQWIFPNAIWLQLGSLAALVAVFFGYRKHWHSFVFRVRALAIVMGWLILFSNASEPHTYIIAFAGYLLFYYTQARHTQFDEIMYWGNFVLFGVFPIDVLCPPVLYDLMHHTLWLDVYFFTLTWIYMICVTMKTPIAKT